MVIDMIKRLCIVQNSAEGYEHFYCYYESGMCRMFDRVTNPIRDFINRDDITREVTHGKGFTEWELTV